MKKNAFSLSFLSLSLSLPPPVGPKAVVTRTAVVVTYNEVDPGKWKGELPHSCPSTNDIIEAKSCHADSASECYVAGNQI